MNTWEIVILIVAAFGLGVDAMTHGKEYKHNFWASLLGKAVTLFLMYMAGLFH